MIAVVCVDDRNGMLFGGRRLSRDRILCADMIRTCGTVRMSAYSAPLFAEHTAHILVDEEFLQNTGAGEACFVETDPLEQAELEGLILYRWNRHYPADRFLAFLPEERGMTLCGREDFAGSSHERITREIWRKENGER